MPTIHPTAVVHDRAELADDVVVGPFCIVGEHVKIGSGTELRSHVVVEGHTTIGERNQIYQFTSIGQEPQDKKYKGEESYVQIGNENIIRESVTIQIGTEGGGLWTKIGDRNLFMTCSHVGHDSIIGDGCILANCVPLAGHVILEDFVILGGLSAVHQFVRIGSHSMAAAGSMVTMDVPPYCYAHGNHARLRGINSIGLTRRGFDQAQVREVRRCYQMVFRKGMRFEDAVARARAHFGDTPPDAVVPFLAFLEGESQRGVSPAGREG